MSFEPGLYVVRFQTPVGAGAGVAHFKDGAVNGGDSMMAYAGTYTDANGAITAQIRAFKHTDVAGMESIFGVDDINISLSGQTSGNAGHFTGTSPQAPGVTLQVSMQRLHG